MKSEMWNHRQVSCKPHLEKMEMISYNKHTWYKVKYANIYANDMLMRHTKVSKKMLVVHPQGNYNDLQSPQSCFKLYFYHLGSVLRGKNGYCLANDSGVARGFPRSLDHPPSPEFFFQSVYQNLEEKFYVIFFENTDWIYWNCIQSNVMKRMIIDVYV